VLAGTGRSSSPRWAGCSCADGPLRTWVAIGVALAGILMFAEGWTRAGLGNLLPSGCRSGSLNVIVPARCASVDMVPAVMIAGLISIPVALPFALPLEARGAIFLADGHRSDWAACS
jgi:hypothetical protein